METSKYVPSRVIAIRPVVTYSEAEKWQKRAYVDTIWVFRPRSRITPATRNFIARMWFKYRAWFFMFRRNAGSGAVLEIATQSDDST